MLAGIDGLRPKRGPGRRVVRSCRSVDPASGLAPRAFGQHQPDTDRAVHRSGEAVSNQVSPALLVSKSALQPSSAYLNDDAKLADVVLALQAKADLDVTNLSWSGPRLLGTLNGRCNYIRQEFRKTSKLAFGHALLVGHIDEWQATILACRTTRTETGTRRHLFASVWRRTPRCGAPDSQRSDCRRRWATWADKARSGAGVDRRRVRQAFARRRAGYRPTSGMDVVQGHESGAERRRLRGNDMRIAAQAFHDEGGEFRHVGRGHAPSHDLRRAESQS